MYAVTSSPLDSLTLAILRKAEFGFFGVVVVTFVQTPLRNGFPFGETNLNLDNELYLDCKAGEFDFTAFGFLGFRTN
jgi:hypothetical protein